MRTRQRGRERVHKKERETVCVREMVCVCEKLERSVSLCEWMAVCGECDIGLVKLRT